MIYILVVLYNKSLQTSDTLQGLLQSSVIIKNINASVMVWDNSATPSLNNSDIAFLKQKFIFLYHHCPANKPLSYVYNNIIEKVSAHEQYKYLVLLDDDSKISSGYFQELSDVIQSTNNADIILPIAQNNNVIISPAKLFFVKGNYFKSIENGFYKGNLLAINSGMAISISFIKRYNFKYDSRLLSYGTDNYIMNFANKKKAKYYIMNSSFEHDYNFYNIKDFKKKAEVFSQIKQANKIAFSSNIIQSILISVYNLMASFKNAIKFRSLKFFS
ncbi:MAG: hypothetical protein ACR2FN_13155 [Chitinophagaceae bacterium]